MTGKTVRLSEIKTNADRRRRKQVHDYIGSMKQIAQEHEVTAFTIVMWTDNGAIAYYDTEALGYAAELRGELSKRVLERVENNMDTVEIVQDLVED